jgi:hypothetical protein
MIPSFSTAFSVSPKLGDSEAELVAARRRRLIIIAAACAGGIILLSLIGAAIAVCVSPSEPSAPGLTAPGPSQDVQTQEPVIGADPGSPFDAPADQPLAPSLLQETEKTFAEKLRFLIKKPVFVASLAVGLLVVITAIVLLVYFLAFAKQEELPAPSEDPKIPDPEDDDNQTNEPEPENAQVEFWDNTVDLGFVTLTRRLLLGAILGALAGIYLLYNIIRLKKYSYCIPKVILGDLIYATLYIIHLPINAVNRLLKCCGSNTQMGELYYSFCGSVARTFASNSLLCLPDGAPYYTSEYFENLADRFAS